MRFSTSARLLSVFALLLLVGCRTYGGYGTEEKTYANIQDAVQRFSEDLDRAKTDLQALQSAADTNEALQPYAERFASEVSRHEATLERHREVLDGLSPSSSYRDLHRQYGAMTTDQRMIRTFYERTIYNVFATVHDEPLVQKVETNKSYYQVEPVDYYQLENRDELTMEEALNP